MKAKYLLNNFRNNRCYFFFKKKDHDQIAGCVKREVLSDLLLSSSNVVRLRSWGGESPTTPRGPSYSSSAAQPSPIYLLLPHMRILASGSSPCLFFFTSSFSPEKFCSFCALNPLPVLHGKSWKSWQEEQDLVVPDFSGLLDGEGSIEGPQR